MGGSTPGEQAGVLTWCPPHSSTDLTVANRLSPAGFDRTLWGIRIWRMISGVGHLIHRGSPRASANYVDGRSMITTAGSQRRGRSARRRRNR
jgi:hypothetical protein